MAEKSCISKIILILITYFLIVPILLLVLIPILILRVFATITAKCHPQIGRLLSPASCHFAVDNLYQDPLGSLITHLTFEGQVEAELFRKRLNFQKFPELKQRLSRWMGFYCWRNDPNFSLDNHISQISYPVDHNEIVSIRTKLLKKPYVEGRPLWELIIYENYTPKTPEVGIHYSTAIFLFHHALCDGYSLLNLYDDLCSNSLFKSNTIAKPNYLKRNFFQDIWFWWKIFILGPFQAIRTVIESKDQNGWKIPLEKLHKAVVGSELKQVGLEDLKQIAKSRGVKTSALIFAAFTGAIRSTMMNFEIEIPKQFTIICPFPLPSHPHHLTNKMTVVPVPSPVWEPDPLKRLQIIEKTFSNLKKSTLPYAFAGLINIVGLIASLTKWKRKSAMGTFILTNFPGPQKCQNFNGIKVSEMHFAAALQNEAIAVGGSAISYNEKIVLSVFGDTSVFSDEKMAQEFINLIVNELEIIRNGKDEFV